MLRIFGNSSRKTALNPLPSESHVRNQDYKRATVKRLTEGRKSGTILLATVSGVGSTKPAMVKYFDRKVQAVGLVTTKSYQVFRNPGNREPIITEPEPGCFGNAVGLRNPGLEQAVAEMAGIRSEGFDGILTISVSASSVDDFITLIQALDPYADIIELNFSCPHAAPGYGASIGCDPELSANYMRAIRDAVGDSGRALLFPKLTPNTEDIGEVARRAAQAGADGISAVNTVGPERYLEPHSGSPILNNALGGKGGKSGTWIFETAVACVGEIRRSVGPDMPIIGMGGVSTGREAAEMRLAGADAVGIGSALGKVRQQDWPSYLAAVKEEAEAIIAGNTADDRASGYLRKESSMQYQPFRIAEKASPAEGIGLIQLDGKLDCGPGEYVFIWLPGVGEKPFSAARTDPLTFLIKDRGPFSKALLQAEPGETVYVRGVYGAEVDLPEKARAVIVAGGTGIAVLPALADKLSRAGTPMTFYYGTSSDSAAEVPLRKELESCGSFRAAADEGISGRILDIFSEKESDLSDAAMFIVGPERFMFRAAEMAGRSGADTGAIMLSMERPSMCGVGMCGECACGDHLTCQYGTFVSYAFLLEHDPELLR